MKKKLILFVISTMCFCFYGCGSGAQTMDKTGTSESSVENGSGDDSLAAIQNLDEPVTGALTMPDYTTETTGRIALFESEIVALISEDGGAIILGGDMNFEGLNNGDLVTIYSDGIMETYPAQAIVKEMVLLERGTVEDLPSDVIEQLSGMGYILQ